MREFLIGIAPEHRVGLLFALITVLLLAQGWRVVGGQAAMGAGWALRLRAGWAGASSPVRWTVWLLLLSAAVHIGVPLGHNDSPLLTLGFIGSAVAGGWLALRAITGRRWRTPAALLLVAMMIAYCVALFAGHEEPDQVGIATVLIELLALTLTVTPALAKPWSVRRLLLRPLANTGVVTLTVLVGVTVWVAFIAGHDDHGDHGTPEAAGTGSHEHGHGEFLARAQAGIVLRPAAIGVTAEQQRAADELAHRTRAAIQRYRELAVAEADGYHVSGAREGLQVHFENSANQHDGRVADPEAPEMLVYAIEGGRSLLMGVVYQMEAAGLPGPAIGGSITRWHAHNVCVGLLPPGFGPVSPYGTCPYLTMSVTIAEMMHVWVVDPPGGAFTESIDDGWVRARLATG